MESMSLEKDRISTYTEARKTWVAFELKRLAEWQRGKAEAQKVALEECETRLINLQERLERFQCFQTALRSKCIGSGIRNAEAQILEDSKKKAKGREFAKKNQERHKVALIEEKLEEKLKTLSKLQREQARRLAQDKANLLLKKSSQKHQNKILSSKPQIRVVKEKERPKGSLNNVENEPLRISVPLEKYRDKDELRTI